MVDRLTNFVYRSLQTLQSKIYSANRRESLAQSLIKRMNHFHTSRSMSSVADLEHLKIVLKPPTPNGKHTNPDFPFIA